MINIPMKSSGAVNKQTVMTINNIKIQGPKSSCDISSNTSTKNYVSPVESNGIHNITGNTPITVKAIPPLIRQIEKGQKFAIENQTGLTKINAKLGWMYLLFF